MFFYMKPGLSDVKPAGEIEKTAEVSSAETDVDDEDQKCPVCWSVLCEPVAWPGCRHHLCLLCSLQTRQKLRPTCPLCRAPAPRVYDVAGLSVDGSRAVEVRRL